MENIIYVKLFNNKTNIHPYINFICNGENNNGLSEKTNEDYYSKIKKSKILWLTFNKEDSIKSVNLNISKYNNFQYYLDNISKNIKRDYLRALSGEKIRNMDINLDTVINKYNTYIKKYNIEDYNNSREIISNAYNNHVSKKSKLIGLYKLLDTLEYKYKIDDDFIDLSQYIRIKLKFKEINMYDHIKDIEYIIKLNRQKNNNNGNWIRYENFINGLKNNTFIQYNSEDKYNNVKWYGVFDFNKLVSFIQINYDGEICGIGFFFSNPNYYKYSCVTFIIINVIKEIIENKKHIKLLNYWANNCVGQLNTFTWKKKFLFDEYKVILYE